MWKNPVFISGLLVLILVIITSVVFSRKEKILQEFEKLTFRNSNSAESVKPISFLNGSTKFSGTVNDKVLTEIYLNEVGVDPAFEPIKIVITDDKQDTSFGWSREQHYASITIRRTAPNGSEVLINIEPEEMRSNGWQDTDIEEELEILLITGITTRPSLTLTAQEIEAKKIKAQELRGNYKDIVSL